MQFSTIVSVLALTATALGAAVEKRSPVGTCPQWRDDAHWLLEDANDCTVFYKCDRSGPVKIACPQGLHFDIRQNWCDYPERAQCNKAIQ
ncbi:hypothetical protein FPQ18DRAFT_86952 [Pyronema domesticum]|uniref:Similar to Peritrophin-1 acc. no. O76217 n=1 Tax=Pyronema omphalodes (strain CBS 100304) TaxID=1076935 RepID=U4L4A8_PYROM|nr:hypothetical protein FPQ18DRAFT_86952 [Pyronema domesticum]CCX07133.1 Similar to Peritrophin-1; acc. no. O76217 [Pyronema omphalodes CBS 100304]